MRKLKETVVHGASISGANRLYRAGQYDQALQAYLDVSLRHPGLSKSVRYNIELCSKKLQSRGSLRNFVEHPRYFRYGHGYSDTHGAVMFDCLGHFQRGAKSALNEPVKVVFVADANPAANPKRKVWGAETSAGMVANFGRSCGADVTEVFSDSFDREVILSADLLVLRSIDRLDVESHKFLRKVLFEHLKPYVTYQHDYAFCRYRNSIKCSGVQSDVCVQCKKASDKYTFGQVAFYTELLSRAALNIFISHPQRHIFGEALGAAIDPSIVILPPVDPEVFKPLGVSRNPRLIVNTSGKLNSPNKGFANIAEFIVQNPSYIYELYTEKNDELIRFAAGRDNVKVLDPVDNRELPLVYSRAQSLLVMPAVMEPAGRTPIEAALCGCSVISNDKLGVGYFNLPMSDSKKIGNLIYKSLATLWHTLIGIARQ